MEKVELRNNHALVIGGTGMLAGASLYLAENGYAVSVIGRTSSKFKWLQSKSQSDALFPIQIDYHSEQLLDELQEAISQRGPFELIVSWMPNYDMLERICGLNSQAERFRLIHVKGSRRYFADDEIRVPSNCMYEKVFLGFVIEGDTSRWLTNKEIANGVVLQIEAKTHERIVGQLIPYSARPM